MKNPNCPITQKKIDLPPKNPLIPKNFDILPKDEAVSAKPVYTNLDGVDLWFMKDDKFERPKAKVTLKVYTKDNDFGTNWESSLFVKFWTRFQEQYLKEFTYMAEMAKLEFDVTPSQGNIELRWSGFNDSIPNYVQETLTRLMGLQNATKEEIEPVFNQVKEKLLIDWKNFYFDQSFRQILAKIQTITVQNAAEPRELRNLLENYSVDDFFNGL